MPFLIAAIAAGIVALLLYFLVFKKTPPSTFTTSLGGRL
jgi:hypothetical protein